VLAPESIRSAKYIRAAKIRGSGTRLVKARSVPIALEVVQEYTVKLGTCGMLRKVLTQVGLPYAVQAHPRNVSSLFL
jgi:hypothetical protein